MPHEFKVTEAYRQAAADSYEGAGTFTKCLSEVLINSYESYERLKQMGYTFTGIPTVRIVADAQGEFFEVFDPFEGIGETHQDMKKIFEKKSSHQPTHTATSRSMMGRGLSDVLTRNPSYYSLLYSKRNGKRLGYMIEWVASSSNPNEKERIFSSRHDSAQELEEIDKKIETPSGAYVKFFWQSDKEAEPFPPKEELVKHLYYYHELRNILSDQAIKFELTYKPREASTTTESLQFYNPKRKKVIGFQGPTPLRFRFDDSLPRNDYKIEILDFDIFEADQDLNTTDGELRTQGVYIQGEPSQGFIPTIYTLTFFGLEDQFPSSSRKIFATLTLSEDTKQYLMDSYDISRPVFTKTRDGFKRGTAFYNALSKYVKSKIIPLLQRSSSARFEESDDATKEGIDQINKFVHEVVDVTPIVTDLDETIDTAKFAKDSIKIVKGKKYKINLLLNPEKFRVGSTIKCDNDPTVIVDPATKIPDFKDEKIGTLPFLIQSDSLGVKKISNDTVALRVKLTAKEGPPIIAKLKIECVEERHIEPFGPTENLQFNPAKTTVKSFEDKNIDLWLNPATVYPGQTIRVTFIPERGMEVTQPIKVTRPDAGELPESHDFSFDVEDTPTLPDNNGYRKKTITFEILQTELRGTIEATVAGANPDQYTAKCEFKVENDSEGIIKDWTVESHAIDSRVFIEEGVAIFNSRVAIVAETLGRSKDDAKKRVKLYEEARLLVAEGLTHVALEKAMREEYQKRTQDYANEARQPWMATYRENMKNYDAWSAKLYPLVSKAIKVGARDTIPEKMHGSKITVTFPNFEEKYNLTWYKDPREAETAQIAGAIKVGMPGFGANSTRITYVFKIKNDEFRVGVYRFDNGNVAVRLDSFDWYTNREMILKHLRDTGAVLGLKAPSSMPKDIPQGWVCAPLEIQCYKQNKLETKKVTSSNLFDVPDHPSLNGSSIPVETDETWIKTHRPREDYVYYSMMADVEPGNASPLNREEFCYFINPDDMDNIALSFVRLFVMRPYAQWDFAFDNLKKIFSQSRECTQCHSVASTKDGITDLFALNLDENTPTLSELCNTCQAKNTLYDKQMSDAFG